MIYRPDFSFVQLARLVARMFGRPWAVHGLGSDVKQIFGPLSWSKAARAALHRREQIDRFIGDGLEAARREFLLSIDESGASKGEMSRADATAQRARLRLQRNSIPHLLLDQLIDVIIAWEREHCRDKAELRSTSVSLEVDRELLASEPSEFRLFRRSEHWLGLGEAARLEWLESHDRPLPFRAVVRTDSGTLRDFLAHRTRDWNPLGLGIGPALHGFQWQVRCSASGECGVFGGAIQATDPRTDEVRHIFAMTCAHVVGGCASVRGDIGRPLGVAAPASHVPVLHQPDGALVERGTCPCSFAPTWLAPIDRVPGERRMIIPYSHEVAAEKHLNAALALPYGKGRNPGYVASAPWLVETGSVWHRAPAYEVLPRRSFLEALARPFDRQFSRDGDSGSWVIHEGQPSEWLGMVIGGIPERRISYAVDAQFLLDFFAEELRSKISKPFILTALC